MGGGGGGSWASLGNLRSLEEKAKNLLREPKRNVFISFATEDMNDVNLLRAQAKNDASDLEFNDHSVREPYNSDRADYIKQRISERIDRCSVTVVYVSPATKESNWVAWEVSRSFELGKRVIAVRSDANSACPLPGWLKDTGVTVVRWSKLADTLRKLPSGEERK